MEFNGEIRVNCRQLVESITKKRASEERINAAIFHLKDCIDYVTEHEVKISIDGLHHKFLLHAEYEKARQFRSLVDKYLELSKPKGLTHPSWSILHLLFRLAYRPTERPNYVLEGPVFNNQSQHPKEFDWGKYLTEGIVLPCLPKNDSPFSDDEAELENESTIEPPPEEDSSIEKIPLFCKPLQVVKPSCLLVSKIQESYWDSGQKQELTEHQVLHEILWALQSKSGTSSLFKTTRNGKIQVRSIRLCSLPSSCLKEHLKTFIPVLEGLKLINDFVYNVMMSVHKTHILTYQAYSKALHTTLMKFYRNLAEFETRLIEQKVTTTLKDLQSIMMKWRAIIVALSDVQIKINEIPVSAENHVKASHILSLLFSCAQQAQITNYETVYPHLLYVFFTTLAPYLNIIDHWLTQGEIVDYFQEFIVTRNESISPQDEHFWCNSVVHKNGQSPLDFMQAVTQDILMAGRSVELLGQSGHLTGFVRQSNLQCGKLYDIFIERFNKFSTTSHQIPATAAKTSVRASMEYESDNPLLNDAFRLIQMNLGPYKKRELSTETLPQTPPEFYPLLPLLEQSLKEPIRTKRKLVCQALLDVLEDCYAFKSHLHNLRRIHLMQAGDLMERFCLDLCKKVGTGEQWKNETSLTLSLLNCISPRLPQASNFVSVSFISDDSDIVELSHIQINYAIPWPVSLIINQDSLKKYNSVFRFLLNIKRALISLQRSSFKEMSSEKSSYSKGETITLGVRERRLQLLRAWLIHFISSLDYYIMECVLESAHIRLDNALLKTCHFGEIIQHHNEFINSVHSQCLQEPSAAYLRDAINEILRIALQVVKVWKSGISSKDLIQLEESYARYHLYVASVLGTDAAHSTLPHVETLAAALICSCPVSETF